MARLTTNVSAQGSQSSSSAAIERLRREVVHAAVTVIDRDICRAAVEGAFYRGIRLTDHQLHGRAIAVVAATRGIGVADAGHAFHVDRDVYARHLPSVAARA